MFFSNKTSFKFNFFMSDNLSHYTTLQRVLQLISLFFVLFGIIMIGSVVFIQTLHLLTGQTFANTDQMLETLKQATNGRLNIILAQMAAALVTFIILPWLYLKYFQRKLLENLIADSSRFPKLWYILIAISAFSFPIISFTAFWNKELVTQLLSSESIYHWIIKSEAEAKQLTELIIYYQSPMEMLLVVVVIAILPAVGEELLFRGIVQKQLNHLLGRPHLAIWIAAFLFSFIHFQFFGFIPRLLLGVLFGYIYFYSKNIWAPILLHFINNFTMFLLANYQLKKGVVDPLEEPKPLPYAIVGVAAILIVMLISYYKKQSSPVSSTI
jgi:membrane protease YdiL (CAAX protease family)